MTGQDNPPPEVKKVGVLPPWKSPGQDKTPPPEKFQVRTKFTPWKKFCARSALKTLKTALFLGVLTWNFCQTRTIPPLERKFWPQSPPWHDSRSGQLSPPWRQVPCTRMEKGNKKLTTSKNFNLDHNKGKKEEEEALASSLFLKSQDSVPTWQIY